MVFFIDCFAWNYVFGFLVCCKHYSKKNQQNKNKQKKPMKIIGKYSDKEINPF